MKKTPLQPHQWTNGGEYVLLLKRLPKDRKAYGGFPWPSGVGTIVTTPDWNDKQECGGGLHAWPWGFGIGDGMDFDFMDDIWLVLGAKPDEIVGELNNGWKCKAKSVVILHEGTFAECFKQLSDGFAACIKNMASGNYSNLAASGNYSNLAASGNYSKLAASGNYSNLAASGNYSKLAASGNDSKLAASGDVSKLAASGNDSNLAASGNYSKLAASGNDSVCAIAANMGRVKVGNRGAFALAYWDDNDGWKFVTGKVGESGVKANTWYEVRDGKLLEIPSNDYQSA